MHKNKILKLKNSLLELEKDFKPITGSIDDIDKLKEKQITNKIKFEKKKHLVRLV